MRAKGDGARFQIYRAQALKSGYEEAQVLPFSVGSTTDVDPVVHPDERYMVFGSARKPAEDMDLFIVFRNAGTWGSPIHLGKTINSRSSDAEPRLSPHGRVLFFSSERISPDSADLLAEWNNGKYNNWSVSLSPFLQTFSSETP